MPAPSTPSPAIPLPDPRFAVCLVIGTRPEAIKMAPVIAAIRSHPGLRPLVVTTAQHREMLSQALDVFGIVPDIDLGLMQDGQNLGVFTSRAMQALTDCFIEHQPQFLLVQGDTSTVTAAAMAAFYQGIPIGHIEAGLRSFDLSSPFPEEINRRIATCTATFHFAPTNAARSNLVAEGVPEGDIFVTGNTVVDALQMIGARSRFDTAALEAVNWSRPVILATVHRRESQGPALEEICDALDEIVRERDVSIVFPVHLNPRVRDVVHQRLGASERIHLVDPLPYPDLLEVMRRCTIVLSDSGGIQEEVPSFRKPILILRDTTERPEVVDAGFGRLVGTGRQAIVEWSMRLLGDEVLRARMSAGANPFGDGRAAARIAKAVHERLASNDVARAPRRLDHRTVNATLQRLVGTR
jgi:UDP-N-acetylglucosamine 2-epimerase (non-hydrolysing)